MHQEINQPMSREDKEAIAAFIGPILGESQAIDNMVSQATMVDGQYSNRGSDVIRQEVEKLDRESRHQRLLEQQARQQQLINDQLRAQQARIEELQREAANPQLSMLTSEIVLPPPPPLSNPQVAQNPAPQATQSQIDHNQLELNFDPIKQVETNKLLKDINTKLTKIISLIESKQEIPQNDNSTSKKTSIPTVPKQSIKDQ